MTLFQCDLLNENNWDIAIQGCDYVFHTASPVGKVSEIKKGKKFEKKDYLQPPVKGMKIILNQCKKYNVKRVIFTSTSGNCFTYLTKNKKVCKISANNWTEVTEEDIKKGHIMLYIKGKKDAEQYFWKFMKDNEMEGVSINPGLVIGPLVDGYSTMPVSLWWGIVFPFNGSFLTNSSTFLVDVRDVAQAHINAMIRPKEVVCGNRYVLAKEIAPFTLTAQLLYDKYGNKYGTTTKPFSDTFLNIMSLIIPSMKGMGESIGRTYTLDNETSVSQLNVKYTNLEKTILDSAESLIKLKLIEPKKNSSLIKKVVLGLTSVGLIVGTKLLIDKYSNTLKENK